MRQLICRQAKCLQIDLSPHREIGQSIASICIPQSPNRKALAMTEQNKAPIPSALLGFMNKPPLIRGESPKEYYEFLEGVIAAMEPKDMIDWLWTLRFTDGSWCVLRLVRFRAALLNGRYKIALHGVIRETKLPVTSSVLRGTYDRADQEAQQEIEQWLRDPTEFAKRQIDPDLVPARALVHLADHVEKLDRMIERAERRCDAIIQLLDVRRAVFASRARQAAVKILSQVTAQQNDVPEKVSSPPLAPKAPDQRKAAEQVKAPDSPVS